MRVVWTYRNYQVAPERYRNKVAGNCEIFSDREFRTFSGCLATWQILAPELTRVLYVDQSVYDFLNQKNILHRFHQVEIVDFEKELDSVYSDIDFFAAPKLWALSIQPEPCFLVDTETMLFYPLTDWYNEEYHFIEYEKENPIQLEHWSPDDIEKWKQLNRELGPDQLYLRPDLMVNAGLTSWPDVRVLQAAGLRMLHICNAVCRSTVDFRYKWTFCEESILRSVVEMIKPQNERVIVHSPEWDNNRMFVEWSSPETVPQIYEEFKWWASHHPRIDVEKMREVDPYAEY